MSNKLQEVITSNSLFPPQNLEGIYAGINIAIAENRPFKIADFACLPSEWITVGNRLVYRVSTDPAKLTRIEQPEFMDRTFDLVVMLYETGVPFKWDFIVADTEITDVFDEVLKEDEDPEPAIVSFRQRLEDRVIKLLPGTLAVPRWSAIQAPFQLQYSRDFQTAYNLKEVKEDIEKNLKARMDFYRRVFTKQGMKISDSMLTPIAKFVPRKNRALYGAQGPIIKSNYDLLIIGDRDPRRLADYQSILVPDLPIWFPYPGG